MKTCSACNKTLPHSAFHRDSRAKGGHQSRCKACRKQDWRQYYLEHRDERLRYERRPERKAAHIKAIKRHRLANPQKAKARKAVTNAKRDGKITQEPCSQCGNPESEAHHDDYSRPLNITWLCRQCHRQVHQT